MHRRVLLFSLGALAVRPAQALYDPKPIPLLAAAIGTWSGTLTYRDYQKPDRMVTLKTVMTVTLTAPDELALYYVFDDGPAKTVHSYERMKFDLAANQMVWNSGITEPSRVEYSITASSVQERQSRVAFKRAQDTQTDEYSWEVTDQRWLLTHEEASGAAAKLLRSKYEFTKRGT